MSITKGQILDEIRRTAQANEGVALGSMKFATETGIKQSDWKGKIWARWSEALREAGFAPNEMAKAYSGEELLEKYAQLSLELGHLPTIQDMRLIAHRGSHVPHWGSFKKQYGNKTRLVEKLLEYCRDRGEFAVIIQYCEDYAPRDTKRPNEAVGSQGDVGYVYLLKSGRFYKIGRSNAPGRREYELAIQLPEKARIVHEIRTEDPPGIEAYWHNKFEAMRKNGEWFELKAADVSYFKRRKIM